VLPARREPDLVRARRRLVIVTFGAWAIFAIWFWLDVAAIAQGRRSFPITLANLAAFAILFVAGTGPVLGAASQLPAASAPGRVIRGPAVPSNARALAYAFVGATLSLAIGTLTASSNDIGYRLKGALLIAGGATFFVLELRGRGARLLDARTLAIALVYFCCFQAAAVLILTLDWSVATHRWIGGAAQLAAGILGFIGCARLLRGQAA
jgi:hypothetical protein